MIYTVPLSIGIATCVKCKIQVRRKIIISSVKCWLYKKYKSHFSFSERCKACLVLEVKETSGHGYQTRTAEDEGTSGEQEIQRKNIKRSASRVTCNLFMSLESTSGEPDMLVKPPAVNQKDLEGWTKLIGLKLHTQSIRSCISGTPSQVFEPNLTECNLFHS